MTLNMNPPRQNDHFLSNQDSLFGYLFSGTSDEPAPTPDAPARGEPLLNDFELDSSHQFFDRFQNDHFADDAKLLEALGRLQQEPAPNFHGVASSLGPVVAQDSNHPRALSFGHFENDLHMRFDQANLTSPHDQFHPQSALPFTPEDFAALDNERPPHSRHYSEAFGPQNTFEQPPPTMSRSRFSRQSAPALGHAHLNFGDQSFANASTIRSPVHQLPQISTGASSGTHTIAPALGFGSDHDFRNQNYVAPRPNLEDLKSAEENIQAQMRILEENEQGSAETTAPSSPVVTKSKRRLSDAEGRGSQSGSAARKSQGSGAKPQTGEKRQRKVKLEDDGDDDDDEENTPGAMPQSSRKGRQSSKARTGSTPNSGQSGRRKSQVGEKPPRQNLTEEEKKQNHIRSEQKRRNQIKDGFTNLIGLMPNDVPSGTSKCAILSQAVEWLHDLIAGNEKLRAQLQGMSDG